MSGPKPRQQASRPRAGKDLAVISKEEAVEIVKEIKVEDLAGASYFDFGKTEGEEDDGIDS